MTTIAFRNGILAADRAIFDRDTYCGETVKIHRSKCGAIGGLTGCFGDSSRFREWMTAGLGIAIDNPPEFKDEGSEALVIDKDGRCFWIGHGKRWVEQHGPYFAAGSGFRIAMGALAAGVSAEQAVKIACDLDAYTRGPVDTLTLKASQTGEVLGFKAVIDPNMDPGAIQFVDDVDHTATIGRITDGLIASIRSAARSSKET